jgi:transcription initiation factor TFIID subunit 2
MADKCTWEFQFVVPRYLEEGAELSEDAASYPTVVVCSGDFGQQVWDPLDFILSRLTDVI